MEIGTLVKIIDNNSGHEFSIGEVVRYVGELADDEFEHLDCSDYWFVGPEDYEIIQE